MIKFFRKIRQKLLSENKFSKYLIYAVGEIVLVVIGILIALQINNWNEIRKEKDQLESSLRLLQLNLNEDIKKFDAQIEYNESVNEAIDKAFKIIAKTPESQNMSIKGIGNLAREKSFYSVTTALRSMESGGHFKFIRDPELKELIYTYYADTERFSKMIESHNQFARDEIEGFAYKYWDLADFITDINPYDIGGVPRVDNKKVVIERVEYENLVVGRKLKTNGEISWSNAAKKRALALHEKIEDYLNSSTE